MVGKNAPTCGQVAEVATGAWASAGESVPSMSRLSGTACSLVTISCGPKIRTFLVSFNTRRHSTRRPEADTGATQAVTSSDLVLSKACFFSLRSLSLNVHLLPLSCSMARFPPILLVALVLVLGATICLYVLFSHFPVLSVPSRIDPSLSHPPSNPSDG